MAVTMTEHRQDTIETHRVTRWNLAVFDGFCGKATGFRQGSQDGFIPPRTPGKTEPVTTKVKGRLRERVLLC